MSDPTPAEIAAGLTKAQKRGVLILSGIWASRVLPDRMVWLDPQLLETTAPLRTGHERVRLTPLGLAVRAYLMEQKDAD